MRAGCLVPSDIITQCCRSPSESFLGYTQCLGFYCKQTWFPVSAVWRVLAHFLTFVMPLGHFAADLWINPASVENISCVLLLRTSTCILWVWGVVFITYQLNMGGWSWLSQLVDFVSAYSVNFQEDPVGVFCPFFFLFSSLGCTWSQVDGH